MSQVQLRALTVHDLGRVEYEDGLALQKAFAAARRSAVVPDTLLLLEHPPVFTRGRRSSDAELRGDPDFYGARGIEMVMTDRGGRITYHGPGQLVGYPIMGVQDVDRHLRMMEAAIVRALQEEGVSSRGRRMEGPDYTGVWAGERKIASIGVHVSRGVSTHGFAVNVDVDLEPFSWVVACGLPGVSMTSVGVELEGPAVAGVPGPGEPGIGPGRRGSLACFRRRMAHSFCVVHGRRQRLVTPRRLGIAAPAAGSAEACREVVAA